MSLFDVSFCFVGNGINFTQSFEKMAVTLVKFCWQMVGHDHKELTRTLLKNIFL